jgi:hypothetical protein
MGFNLIGYLGMKNGYRTVQILLLLPLIFSIPAYFAFVDCYALSGADFLSRQLKLESPDQINLPTCSRDKVNVGLTGFSHSVFVDDDISEQLPFTSFQVSPLGLTTFFLRC